MDKIISMTRDFADGRQFQDSTRHCKSRLRILVHHRHPQPGFLGEVSLEFCAAGEGWLELGIAIRCNCVDVIIRLEVCYLG